MTISKFDLEAEKVEILKLFEKEYIENGFMYSGSIPVNSVLLRDRLDILIELANEGKLEKRNCEALSYQLPRERRRELIKEHGLDKKWEEGSGRAFYPNSAHGEVTVVFGRTQDVLRAEAELRLHHDSDGYFVFFDSSSSNKTYKARYWTEKHKQFRAGDFSCDCLGWIFRKRCRHTDELKQLLIDAGKLNER